MIFEDDNLRMTFYLCEIDHALPNMAGYLL